MFISQDLWESEYNAVVERNTVEYILADRFDDIHLADLKESFENCMRVDSLNTLTAPLNFYNFRGINVKDPVSNTDVANKGYTDKTINDKYQVVDELPEKLTDGVFYFVKE